MPACPPSFPRFLLIWGKKFNLDRSKSETILGIKYRDLKETLVEMAEWMINSKMIPDNR